MQQGYCSSRPPSTTTVGSATSTSGVARHGHQGEATSYGSSSSYEPSSSSHTNHHHSVLQDASYVMTSRIGMAHHVMLSNQGMTTTVKTPPAPGAAYIVHRHHHHPPSGSGYLASLPLMHHPHHSNSGALVVWQQQQQPQRPSSHHHSSTYRPPMAPPPQSLHHAHHHHHVHVPHSHAHLQTTNHVHHPSVLPYEANYALHRSQSASAPTLYHYNPALPPLPPSHGHRSQSSHAHPLANGRGGGGGAAGEHVAGSSSSFSSSSMFNSLTSTGKATASTGPQPTPLFDPSILVSSPNDEIAVGDTFVAPPSVLQADPSYDPNESLMDGNELDPATASRYPMDENTHEHAVLSLQPNENSFSNSCYSGNYPSEMAHSTTVRGGARSMSARGGRGPVQYWRPPLPTAAPVASRSSIGSTTSTKSGTSTTTTTGFQSIDGSIHSGSTTHHSFQDGSCWNSALIKEGTDDDVADATYDDRFQLQKNTDANDTSPGDLDNLVPATAPDQSHPSTAENDPIHETQEMTGQDSSSPHRRTTTFGNHPDVVLAQPETPSSSSFPQWSNIDKTMASLSYQSDTTTTNKENTAPLPPPHATVSTTRLVFATAEKQKPPVGSSNCHAQHLVTGHMMKSPITMCFERMIGAAKVIAQDPSLCLSNRKPMPRPSTVVTQGDDDVNPPMAMMMMMTNMTMPTKRRQSVTMDLEDAYDELNEQNPFELLEEDPELQRRVILQMALQRQPIEEGGSTIQVCSSGSPSNKSPTTEKPISNIIYDGFFWRDYPACEHVLYEHMAEYYNVSCIQRLSKSQQSFNNLLVQSVRQAAESTGHSFHEAFDDKKLRDRIRCFYKTHLQNAKKGLVTLQKHATSSDHQAILRVYVRCVRFGMSFEESVFLEPDPPAGKSGGGGNSQYGGKKRGRPTKVARVKQSLQQQYAHQYLSSSRSSTVVPLANAHDDDPEQWVDHHHDHHQQQEAAYYNNGPDVEERALVGGRLSLSSSSCHSMTPNGTTTATDPSSSASASSHFAR